MQPPKTSTKRSFTRLLKRIAIAAAVTCVLGTAGLAIAVVIREDRTFDAPYPELHARTDAATIARGRYLAHGPAHCVSCHAGPGGTSAAPALSGGGAFHLPVGTIYARNITPDRATGIGRYTDPEIARLLRFGVHPSGRAVLPFMGFANLCDDDVVAVLSYLRSLPPVRHAVPPTELTWLGRFARAFLLEPTGPTGRVPAHVEPGPTVAYGAYLATTVANCAGCHTKRSLRTGAAIGALFAGGMTVESHDPPGTTFVTPNLTPHASGKLAGWTEDMFVARFKAGVRTASPMPWDAFATMTDDDLRAIYRYLRTVPAAPTEEG